jgi:hypothetical protein
LTERGFFQVYAFFLSGLLCFIFWMSLKQVYTWVEWLDLPMTVVALSGVWGYAFWPRMCGWFWHAVLGGILVWDLVFNFFLRSFAHWGVHSRASIYAMLAVGFALFLPEYIALYLYGFAGVEQVQRAWQLMR